MLSTPIDANIEPPGSHDDPIVIRPTRGLAALNLGAVWEYRELLYFLAWRDVKVRYKQTALGVLWVVLQPLVSMSIYTILFGRLLAVPSGDAPYAVFAFAGLLPWTYFASALSRSAASLVGSQHLITKVYFPRLVVPLSSVLSSLVDLGVALVLLVGVMIVYGIAPSFRMLVLPALILQAMITAIGFGLWLSALNVRYRDINYLVPFLIQIWMYATPVVYGSNLIPETFRWVLALNPMTGVVEGFRWALLGRQLDYVNDYGLLMALSVVITMLVLVSGAFFFRTTERTFADIV